MPTTRRQFIATPSAEYNPRVRTRLFSHAVVMATLILLRPPGAGARVWHVAADSSGDFLTIADAIRAASSGDEIDIGPGKYMGALDTQGKAVSLIGLAGPGAVVVDANREGSALKIPFTGPPMTIRGITFTGGNGTILTGPEAGGRYGGGLFIETASPLIEDCRIVENDANVGGGVFVIAGAPRLVRCEIQGNSAGYGGGIGVDEDAGFTVTDCDILGNIGVFGGGIDAFNSQLSVEGCRIRDNEAIEGSAIRLLESGSLPSRILASVITGNPCTDGAPILARRAWARLDHLTVADNIAAPVSAIVQVDDGDVGISNSIIAFGGTTLQCNGGNLTLDCVVLWSPGGFLPNCSAAADAWTGDPRFCDHAAGKYTLRGDSPCLPGHGPTGCGLIGALDVGCYTSDVDAGASRPSRQIRWGALKGSFR